MLTYYGQQRFREKTHMTPAALRALALSAEATSRALSQDADAQRSAGDSASIHAAMCYTVSGLAFMTFARILAEAANEAEGK